VSTTRLFFLLGSVIIPTIFGIIIPMIMSTTFKVNAFWVGAAFLFCALLPEKLRSIIFYPINKVANLLGYINQTIIMGIIFYGLFMPISLFRKLKGSDQLRLKKKGRTSYWNEPDQKWINFDQPY
tara:strand:+ start:1650 stop:2024 length:375 start_codon:yes stop_codon:yes gene_type:complete